MAGEASVGMRTWLLGAGLNRKDQTMHNSEGAGPVDGSGNGVTRFAAGEPAVARIPVMRSDVAFNFATRGGQPLFVDLSTIQAVHEVTLHDANGKRGTNLILSSGKELETTTPLADVLTALGW